MKHAIQSHAAPAAVGPYSQAIELDGWIFCSGQIGLDATTGKLVEGGIEVEMRRVMENLREVLDAADARLADVIKTTIFLTDLKDFDTVNRIYSEHFEQPYPARSTVQVSALPRSARVEIEVIARRSNAVL